MLMNDIFEEYGSLIIAIVAAVLIIGGGAFLMQSGSFVSWISQYIDSLGG